MNMKKIFISILILISINSFSQFKTYGLRINADQIIDTIKHKQFTDSLFINGVFVAHIKSYYDQQPDIPIPGGFGNYTQRGDNLWTNFQNFVLYSGTYTPTLFNTTNVAASSANSCAWIRIGVIVYVTGTVSIDATAAASTLTELGVSLPVASDIAGAVQVSGTAASDAVASLSARIKGDAANNRATISFRATSSTNDTYSFTFSYSIQ